eukprot:2654495-Amphidinium_carterae.1
MSKTKVGNHVRKNSCQLNVWKEGLYLATIYSISTSLKTQGGSCAGKPGMQQGQSKQQGQSNAEYNHKAINAK